MESETPVPSCIYFALLTYYWRDGQRDVCNQSQSAESPRMSPSLIRWLSCVLTRHVSSAEQLDAEVPRLMSVSKHHACTTDYRIELTFCGLLATKPNNPKPLTWTLRMTPPFDSQLPPVHWGIWLRLRKFP